MNSQDLRANDGCPRPDGPDPELASTHQTIPD